MRRRTLIWLAICFSTLLCASADTVTMVSRRSVRAVAWHDGTWFCAGPGGVFRLDDTGEWTVSSNIPDVQWLYASHGRLLAANSQTARLLDHGGWHNLTPPPGTSADAWALDRSVWCVTGSTLWRLDSHLQWVGDRSLSRDPGGPALLAVEDDNVRWIGSRTGGPPGAPLSLVLLQGHRWVATTEGLFREEDRKWTPSAPTDRLITALSADGDRLTAVDSDGNIWSYRAGQWSLQRPGHADVTCAARHGQALVFGTATRGPVLIEGGEQAPDLRTDPPPSPVFEFAVHGDQVWVSTFADGIWVRNNGVWTPVRSPSRWMRQMAIFEHRLWVRDANGGIWTYNAEASVDGLHAERVNTKPAWTSFLRLVNGRLFLGGYGGFTELVGETWRGTWHLPALKGQIVTDVAVNTEGTCVATARGGVFCVGQDRGVKHFSLPDPWVDALAVNAGVLVAGTHNGGLLEAESAHDLTPLGSWATRHVTALATDSAGRLWLATLGGLFVRDKNRWTRLLPDEVLAMNVSEHGTWVSTRAALVHITWRPNL